MIGYDDLFGRYQAGEIGDEQLDGTGAAPGSVHAARNYVKLDVITQIQADAIRAGARDPARVALEAENAELLALLGDVVEQEYMKAIEVIQNV